MHNREGLPKEICDLKEKEVKGLKRGRSLFKQKVNLTCVTWRDRKPVTFLSTIPTSITDSNVVQRSVKENGQWIQKDFARPGVVGLYNTCMGGVDVSD